MIFSAPNLDDDLRVIAEIDGFRKKLRNILHQPQTSGSW